MNMKTEQAAVVGALIGLVHVCGNAGRSETSDRLILHGLYAAARIPDGETEKECSRLIQEIDACKYQLAPDCAVCANPCGNTDAYDMNNIEHSSAEVRAEKTAIWEELKKLVQQMIKMEEEGANLNDKVSQAEWEQLYRGLNQIGE